MGSHKSTKISIIGLGKVGSCLLAVYAEKGFEVVGVDINELLVKKINNGDSPYEEKDLQMLLTKNKARIKATSDIVRAIEETDITFIIVPTPSDPSGKFVIDYVRNVAEKIGEVLKEKKNFHVVSLVSTVLPGDSNEHIIPALERVSGKRVGIDFGYAYDPSFIAIGSVIHDILEPDIHLIGEYDKQTGDILETFHRKAGNNQAPIERMSVESAEITKIALNSYVTQKITFANILSDLCHRVPHANVDDVTRALGGDRRIGKYYLKAGMGYGGPCFPRDNLAFSYATKKYGVEQNIALSVHNYNEKMVDTVFEKTLKYLTKDSVVAILGLSYKPDASLLEEAQGLKMAEKLIKEGYRVALYDAPPRSDPGEKLKDWDKGFHRYHTSLDECIKTADVYFIAYLSKDFDAIVPFILNSKIKKIVIDPWRSYKTHFENATNVLYVPLGIKE